MSKGFRVTVENLDTGQSSSDVIAPGDYALVCFGPCELKHVADHGNGTVVLTLKGHAPEEVKG